MAMQSPPPNSSIFLNRGINCIAVLYICLTARHISSSDQLNVNVTPAFVEEVTKTLIPWSNVALDNVMQNATSQIQGNPLQRGTSEPPAPPPATEYVFSR